VSLPQAMTLTINGNGIPVEPFRPLGDGPPQFPYPGAPMNYRDSMGSPLDDTY
jgi:hypothetical protein